MKDGNLSIAYGALAVISVLTMVCYFLWSRKITKNFLCLSVCVAVANCGYYLLSIAKSLTVAMFANTVSYFGAAYSVLAMLFIIYDVCRMKKRNWLRNSLIAISSAAFLLAASGDTLGLYYQSVDVVLINGMTKLVKVYGPLHSLYMVYLVSYVLIMVTLILYAAKKQRLASPKYSMLLMSAVMLNILVWAVEQRVDTDFEFLSVSYVVSEVFLLLLWNLLQDYGIIQPGGEVVSVQMLTKLYAQKQGDRALPPGMAELFDQFAQKATTLSAAERRILNYYIDGYEAADIPDLAFISIHTVKKHNRSIYQKLDVASRDELMLYIELFRSCGRLHELSGDILENK